MHDDYYGTNGNFAYDLGHRDARHAAAELVAAWNRRAQAVPAVPQGWKMVPVEPTAEMIAAGAEHCFHMGSADPDDEREVKDQTYISRGCAFAAYSDMLATAPSAAQSEAVTGDVLEAERAQFEPWAISMDYCIDRDETPKYINYHRATTRFAWEAWQARAAIAASRSTASPDEKDAA